MSSSFVPHEAGRQAAIHTCWPADPDLWRPDIAAAESEFAGFLRALSAPGRGGDATPLVVYAASARAEANARRALRGAARIVRAPYGDVWARDTGPVFALDEAGAPVAIRFRFNGWGGKYEYPGDETIGAVMTRTAGATTRSVDLVAEGGAFEFDGEGTVITTRDCLLNANRNPGLSEQAAEDRLKAALGVAKVIWLDEGLAGDHTDGHVDNLARFVRPGLVVCQAPCGPDDPQKLRLEAVARQLARAVDARGRRLRVTFVPSPGRVMDAETGGPAAASHMNYVLGARTLVMPAYTASARPAAAALQGLFPNRLVVARSARHILTGGGAFHCVTSNQPAAA